MTLKVTKCPFELRSHKITCVIERLRDFLTFRITDLIQLLLKFLWTTFVIVFFY